MADTIETVPFAYFDALVMGWGHAARAGDKQTADALRQLVKQLCAGEPIDVMRPVVIGDPQKYLDYTDKAQA